MNADATSGLQDLNLYKLQQQFENLLQEAQQDRKSHLKVA